MKLALDTQAALEAEGVHVRVVSMPSQNLFDEQDAAYKERSSSSSCDKNVWLSKLELALVGANTLVLQVKHLLLILGVPQHLVTVSLKNMVSLLKMQVNFTNHCKKKRAWLVQVLFLKYYIELDFLGHSVRMTVSADLAQLVEQRIRNA